MKNINPTHTDAWKKLEQHFLEIKDVHMKDMFLQHPERAANLTIQWQDFFVDYSKNRITSETLELFSQLAKEVDLQGAIAGQFSGEKVNATENRAVLHTALRANSKVKYELDGTLISSDISQVKLKIKTFTTEILNGKLRGFSGEKFTDVVNIGIGGSDLGPAMVVDALKYYKTDINTHFVSNVDGDHVNEVLKTLNPKTTLFVIVSKTFTTQETLSNAETIKAWFLESASLQDVAKHFVAVSTNIESVKNFGIDEDQIFPMWDWVGGRFSLWSAVGLSISLSVGYSNFEQLLEGANKMDEHFVSSNFKENIPVVLAFLSIWYNNFFKAETEAIIPYSQYLNLLPSYLQQAIMESNGKSVDRNGKPITYQTGNIVWGAPGTNAQHAFFQLIHQGTKLIPADFIAFAQSLHGNQEHQEKLISNYIAQTEALLKGKSESQVTSENNEIKVIPFKIFEGNKPTNSIFIKKLTPKSLGKLIAMYEHKIFVQGVIWNIYSYDQFGVELGKQLAGNILNDLKNNTSVNHDESTLNLMNFFKELR